MNAAAKRPEPNKLPDDWQHAPHSPGWEEQKNDLRPIRRLVKGGLSEPGASPHDRPLIDALILLSHAQPGDTGLAMIAHKLLLAEIADTLRQGCVLWDWQLPLLYAAVDFIHSGGYQMSLDDDPEWVRKHEWRMDPDGWALYDLPEGTRFLPQKA